MEIIKSKIFSSRPEIIFGFSTKIGLNREAPFHFNLSKSVTDSEEIVDENRQAFFEKLNIADSKICIQKQIHSDIVTYADENYKMIESDALFTDKPNISLVISSADCVPVFLFDPEKRFIAGIHSGWRGTEQKIVQKTLKQLFMRGVKPENIIAFIAPCISGKNYEVGPEVANQFDSKYIRKLNKKYLLDLKLCNYDMLIKAGVQQNNIEVSQLCSFEENELLHSYRREGKVSGRAVGVINLRGD